MVCSFIIGDIHGEIRLLNKLLKEIDSYQPEELVFVGDFIDRGPHSRLVIDRLMNLDTPSVFLMGNHELMLLNAIENMAYGYSPIELWYYNGAEATLQSFGANSFFNFQSVLEGKYLDFFRNLKMCHVTALNPRTKLMVTHAGISPAVPLSDHLQMANYRDLHAYILKKHLEPGDSFLWVRDEFFYASPELWEDYLIVHGHTPVNKLHRFVDLDNNGEWDFYERDIAIRYNRTKVHPVSIDIDSGSSISGRLTGLGFLPSEGRIKLLSVTVSIEETVTRDLAIF